MSGHCPSKSSSVLSQTRAHRPPRVLKAALSPGSRPMSSLVPRRWVGGGRAPAPPPREDSAPPAPPNTFGGEQKIDLIPNHFLSRFRLRASGNGAFCSQRSCRAHSERGWSSLNQTFLSSRTTFNRIKDEYSKNASKCQLGVHSLQVVFHNKCQ